MRQPVRLLRRLGLHKETTSCKNDVYLFPEQFVEQVVTWQLPAVGAVRCSQSLPIFTGSVAAGFIEVLEKTTALKYDFTSCRYSSMSKGRHSTFLHSPSFASSAEGRTVGGSADRACLCPADR